MPLNFAAQPNPHTGGYTAWLEIVSPRDDLARPRLSALLPAHGDQSLKVELLTEEEVHGLIGALTALLPHLRPVPEDPPVER
ncbi:MULTISPECIES: hypothetical protein [unclassified Streptomyces]|uniref:hypothetical protein n=1 Tax=unclassified Streptomyces TaxID=2593676 RepID=UPI00364008D4